MTISVIGLSHKTAPTEVRELVAMNGDEVERALLHIKALDSNAQSVIVSTCNRVELYTTLDDMSAVINWLTHYHKADENKIIPHLYSYHGRDAASHLMRVASGLDSMVLGEPQILGQLKNAFAKAKLMHSVGFELECVFNHAFSCAKAVRTLTSIGKCPVSVALSAISIGKSHIDLNLANVAIIGAGKTGELLLKHLNDNCHTITLFNRTLNRAQEIAKPFSCQAKSLDELSSNITNYDLVITATASQTPIITREMLHDVQNNTVIVDIAMPRDVEARVAELPLIKLFSIDDIHQTIKENTLSRSQASIHASEIVEQHINRYESDLCTRDAAPFITDVRADGERIRNKAIAKANRLLDRGVDPQVVIEQLAYNLTNKLLHKPTKNLRDAGLTGQTDVLEFAQKLFKR